MTTEGAFTARSWLFAPGDSAKKMVKATAGPADAVIFDDEHDVLVARREHHIDPCRMRVLGHVAERFLRHPIERHFSPVREVARFEALHPQLSRDPHVFGPRPDESRQGSRQSELVERTRPQLPSKGIQIPSHPLSERERLGELGSLRAVQLLMALEREPERRQLLPEIVVQITRDPRAFFFLGVE